MSREAPPVRSAEVTLRATALTATSIDGSIDVTISELPLIHLFVPDEASALDGARLIIARALAVDPISFDVRLGGSAARA